MLGGIVNWHLVAPNLSSTAPLHFLNYSSFQCCFGTALLWVRTLRVSWMVTNPDFQKHLFLADSCPQAETENTHLISSHSPDIGSECRSHQAAPVMGRDTARPLDRGLWFCDLMTLQNCNYLFTCICDVRQAWRTEIICGNLYGSVANDKRTIKGLYRSSPKGLLKCLRKVLVPLVPGDRDSQGTSSKYWGLTKEGNFMCLLV